MFLEKKKCFIIFLNENFNPYLFLNRPFFKIHEEDCCILKFKKRIYVNIKYSIVHQ